MTTQRQDPNRPLFADMDDEEEALATDRGASSQPAPIAADPMSVNPATGGAIPLGAPASDDGDGTERDETARSER